MNRFLIDSLIRVLLDSGQRDGIPREKVTESLRAASAKAWLAETGKSLCDTCSGEWSYPQDDTAEILNGRWENTQNPCGRKAPYYTKIRIFGGFVNDHGEEFIPPDKEHRAEEIRATGWS